MNYYLKATGLLAGMTFGTNLLGFVREMLFARAFGAHAEADAYVSAFSIVALCFLIFSGGALQGAFMPRYQERLVCEDYRGAINLWQATLTPLVIILILVSLCLILGAEVWVELVVPGFEKFQKQLTAKLLIWLSPMVLFMGLGSLFQSVSHAHRHFFLPALMPILNNVVIIFFLIMVVPKFGIFGLTHGALMGAALWLFMYFFVRRLLPIDLPNKKKGETQDLFHGMLPLIILLVADQISALFQKNIVSGLESGSIAILNYAARIEALPVGIFGAAIAAVFFPALVEAVSSKDSQAVKRRFQIGIAGVFLCAVPATIFLMMKSYLLVKILFERGAFDPIATRRASQALFYYAAGLVPQCLIVFVNRVYFAAGDTKTPMKVGVASAAIHVLFCWLFVRYFGYLGIAMGTSLYAVVYVGLLILYLRNILNVSFPLLWSSSWRTVLGGLAMIITYWCLGLNENLLGLLLSFLTGVTVFLTVICLLRDPVLFNTSILHGIEKNN